MANMIERFLDFMKLSYDDDYDEEEENETYEEPIKTRGIKNKEKDKTDSISKDSRKGTQAVDRTSRKEGKSQNRSDTFSGSRSVKTPVRSNSNVSVIGGGNNVESEIVSIRPKDDKARQEIGDRLLEGKTVLINMEGLELDVAQRIVDFTFGVCYAIKGNMKFPSKYIVIAVPDEVGLSGEFESSSDSSGRRSAGSKTSFEKSYTDI
ncbi:MAG: cell division protein SepF [Lachnospiraceae bacterium]|nr:cell division protein SepF [Lachnospiraceae bacterium]MDY4970294.1 cell division protein SepF [Lachnospiraceae bacterium]